MSDEIKPALSAEEWRGEEYPNDGRPSVGSYWIDRDGDLKYYDGDSEHWLHSRHTLAALALHGQLFGFTHEHLRNLEKVRLRLLRDPEHQTQDEIRGADVEEVMRIIAALLPPEGA